MARVGTGGNWRFVDLVLGFLFRVETNLLLLLLLLLLWCWTEPMMAEDQFDQWFFCDANCFLEGVHNNHEISRSRLFIWTWLNLSNDILSSKLFYFCNWVGSDKNATMQRKIVNSSNNVLNRRRRFFEIVILSKRYSRIKLEVPNLQSCNLS